MASIPVYLVPRKDDKETSVVAGKIFCCDIFSLIDSSPIISEINAKIHDNHYNRILSSLEHSINNFPQHSMVIVFKLSENGSKYSLDNLKMRINEGCLTGKLPTTYIGDSSSVSVLMVNSEHLRSFYQTLLQDVDKLKTMTIDEISAFIRNKLKFNLFGSNNVDSNNFITILLILFIILLIFIISYSDNKVIVIFATFLILILICLCAAMGFRWYL